MALKVSVEQVAELLLPEVQAPQALNTSAQSLSRLCENDDQSSEIEGVRRRSFLAVPGAGLLNALTPIRVSSHLPFAHVVKDLSAAMLAPLSGTTGSESAAVAQLEKQVCTAWHLRQRASYECLGRLLPDLIAEVETNAADQDKVGRVYVHAYSAASSLLKTLGDEPLALIAADRAVGRAKHLDDRVLVAAAMYRMANVLLTSHRLAESRAVALQAADLVEPGKVQTPRSLAVWGGLLLTAAVAAARRGDEPGAWELMGEARAASQLLGIDHADLYCIFGPTNVAIHGVQVAVELRNGIDAVRRSQVVDSDRLPESLVERRSQFLIDVSHGHALQGNDGEAVTTLLRAERIAPQEVRLSSTVHHLTGVLLNRERSGGTPGLRDLARRMGIAG